MILGLSLVVPAMASAQSFQELQIQALLQEDMSDLVLLNGQGAVQNYLLQLLILLTQFNEQQNNDFFIPQDDNNDDLVFIINDRDEERNNNDDEPDVDTFSARDIEDDEAELRGEVDMNDFRNGLVFFVYGEDEDEVEDAVREDEYRDIDERGDDLQKVIVDRDLDRSEEYERTVRNLDEDTRIYFTLCVEYEDEDDDEALECGDIEDFRTGDNRNSSGGQEPEARTFSARDIKDDEAELRGSVDMNNFRDGVVFFLYGEDEDEVEDATREDSFNDIDERGDDLQKVRVDSDLDGEDNFERTVTGIDDDTRHYFTICVEYEDEDDDEALECGLIEEFRTDN